MSLGSKHHERTAHSRNLQRNVGLVTILAILVPAAMAQFQVAATFTKDMPNGSDPDRFLFRSAAGAGNRIVSMTITLTPGIDRNGDGHSIFFDTVGSSWNKYPGAGVANPGWGTAEPYLVTVGKQLTGYSSSTFQFPPGAPSPSSADGAIGMTFNFPNPTSKYAASYENGMVFGFTVDVDGWNDAGLGGDIPNGTVIATGVANLAVGDQINFDVVYAHVHIVKPGGGGDFATIQSAIDSSSVVNGDIVELWTNGGSDPFTGTGNRNIDFSGKAVTIRSKTGNWGRWTSATSRYYEQGGACDTVIDCNANAADTARGFLFNSGEGTDSVLEGVTITDGYTSMYGGAIYGPTNAEPTIVNCIMHHNESANGGAIAGNNNFRAWFVQCIICTNTARQKGGGAFCNLSSTYSPFFVQCWINNNEAIDGGGMYLKDCVTNCCTCLFSDNAATSTGGAFVSDNSTNVMCHSKFTGNTAGSKGCVARLINSSTVDFYYCTITNNGSSSQQIDAAISVGTGCTVIAEQTIVANTKGGQAVAGEGTATATFTACNVYGNSGGDWVGLIEGQDEDERGRGACNFSADPLFCGVGFGDLTVGSGSPCTPEHNCCGLNVGYVTVGCDVEAGDETLYEQPPHPPFAWQAVISDHEVENGLLAYDDFYGISDDICDLHWWGLSLNNVGWFACDPVDMTFEAKFYPDDGTGLPDRDNPVCTYALAPIPTEIAPGAYAGFTLWLWESDLDPCCALTDGWLSIQSLPNPNGCAFLWMGSGVGNGRSLQDLGYWPPEENDFDLSFRLTGGILADGACCLADYGCIMTDEADCTATGGTFLGYSWLCGEDCDSSGGDDACELADGIAEDCNLNGVLDHCDIDWGTSQDCNSNGIPDECELADNSSQDCNTNGYLDECDIEQGMSQDCDANGVPDECDLADGTRDCNTNGYLDECDIAYGVSPDCNSNGVPDECETATADITAEYAAFTAKIFELNPPEPMGSGSGNLSTICNGVYPPVGSGEYWLQYDTYHEGDQGDEDWMGYEFYEKRTFRSLIFQEGMHFWDGGWYDEWQVQVRVDDEWTDVTGLVSEPPYPGNNGVNFETFTLTFEPLAGDAIRLYGDPGGEATFISIGELRVIAGDHPTYDCNTNGVLDECDIADGTSQDADSNGIPDECEAPPICPGDSNCDEAVSWRDIDYFVAAMNDNVAAWEAMFAPGTPSCSFENNDANEDGTVNWRDIDPFVALMNTTCP
ncbi:MAG: right-handed parallel beta-helix repeat-containing protein [Phycisphaerae bacterium]|nr:right-handed parallel beta-helix repeat-containing protein [Phycisphaerae bacterium]